MRGGRACPFPLWSGPPALRITPAGALVLWLTCAAIPGEAGSAAEAPDAPLTAGDFYRRGIACKRTGDFAGAVRAFRLARVLRPGDISIEREFRNARIKWAAELVDGAREKLKAGDTQAAIAGLRQAYDLDPRCGAARLLQKAGHAWHRGRWRSREEVERYEREDRARTETRRKELDLDARFRVLRTDHFRIFARFPNTRPWNRYLADRVREMESLLAAYKALWEGLTDPADEDRGLTVVLFRNQREFVDYRKKHGWRVHALIWGCYRPERKASLFYKQPSLKDERGTLLHELVHQLNAELLHGCMPRWMNEGLARYFESAKLAPRGGLLWGRPRYESLIALRSALRGHPDRYIPLAKLMALREFGAAARSMAAERFIYDEAWAWVYFFLHTSEERRQLLLACIRKEQARYRELGQPGVNNDIYIDVFRERGITPQSLEGPFRSFVKSIPLKGR